MSTGKWSEQWFLSQRLAPHCLQMQLRRAFQCLKHLSLLKYVQEITTALGWMLAISLPQCFMLPLVIATSIVIKTMSMVWVCTVSRVTMSFDKAGDSRASADLRVRFGGPSQRKWETPPIDSLASTQDYLLLGGFLAAKKLARSKNGIL